ncbi:protein HMF1 [Nadsonia fulvescens var. elongata DSM 6958]|uniref:Protein HMF1 n=1 Tax=Nadsonia fulvescens var. elongata DSM 6958 TaxID=857566 RepID=A0A1E3PPF4_9ASCO|nr:protein HMF1 [Nadsonia fulvescens var. elongata DSM 6958]
MSIVPITAAGAPVPVAPYSQAIKAGGFLYLSGQVPLKATGELVTGDIQDQTHQIFHNIKAVLEAAGVDLTKVVKVNIFLVDMAQFSKVNEVYAQYFNVHRPARSCVAVKELPMKVDIEIECIALAA